MRIVYYTQPWFLDTSLPLVRAMSRRVELHVLLELSQETRRFNWFANQETSRIQKFSGMHLLSVGARQALFPEAANFVADVASFGVVVHTSRRALAAPQAIRTTLSVAARIWALRPSLLHVEHAWARNLPLFYLTPGLPKLLAIHDVNLHPGDQDRRLHFARRLAVPRSTRLLFYSRYTQHQYADEMRARGLPERPTSSVPLGIRETFREWPGPDVAERDPTVLFLGRLSVYKGLDVLFQALPQVARAVPGLRVVVAGDAAPDYRVPPLPELSGGAQLITHFAPVDNVMLRRLFQEASVVVAPYLEASQSGVVQTAYAFGKPVVASAVGGLPEAVQHGVTGLLVPPGDADALAQAMISLLLDRPRRTRMCIEIGQLEATHFGWQYIGEQLQAIYEATATRRRAARLEPRLEYRPGNA